MGLGDDVWAEAMLDEPRLQLVDDIRRIDRQTFM